MKGIFTVALGLAALAPVGAIAQDSESPQTTIEFGSPMEEVQAELAREFDQLGTMFAEIFATEPLTAEEEARLPLAAAMTDYVFPVGSFAVAMEDSMEPMMNAMMSRVMDDPAVAVSAATGVPYEELAALEQADLQEALDLFDPHHAARNERIGQMVVTMMGDMFAGIEPSYREGLSRAYATRFEVEEMEQLIAFFQTPVGGKFARQSLLVQYDPQMMAIMEQMGPAMSEVMPGMIEEIMAIAEAYPDGRGFADLGAAEKTRAARLLGRSEAELEALQPVVEEELDELDEMGLTS